MITPEEYKYLSYVLSCATNYTVARGEHTNAKVGSIGGAAAQH